MGNLDKNESESFTKVPNELLDKVISQKLSRAQLAAVLYIIRKTCGFHKAEDKISISDMARRTGYTRRSMISAVHDLEQMGILKCGSVKSGAPTRMMINGVQYWDQEL